MKQNGGDIIGVGTYGCVFKPPLKCKNKTRKRNGISKLMIQENALDEIMTTQDISKRIELIPNYKKYFILSKQFCILDKLSTKDEMHMKRLCDETIIKDYEEKKNLISHNQPYGGKNLHIILLEKSKLSETKQKATLIDITKKLKDLLLYGIVPMHKMNIFHTDIKPQNLVWNKKTIKLIDWGLGVVDIPEKHYNVIHFNRPYESILLGLNDGVSQRQLEKYVGNEAKKYKENIAKEPIKSDLYWFFLSDDSNIKIIVKYVNMIGRECMKQGKFDKGLFLKNYYRKQDYWGLIYCYIDILRTLNIKSNVIIMKIVDLCNLMVSTLDVNVKSIVDKMTKIEEA